MNLKVLSPKEARKLISTNPVAVITSINKDQEVDAMSVAWLSTVSFNPTLIQVSISSKRYTHSNLEENGEFVVNLLERDQADKVMEVGSVSFRENKDKVKEAGFNLREGKHTQVPQLKQAVGWLECKVQDQFEAGDHTIFVGQVLGGEIKKELWQGRFLAEKADLLHHLGGNKFLCQGDLVEV